jgi:hypothetical protein
MTLKEKEESIRHDELVCALRVNIIKALFLGVMLGSFCMYMVMR